MNPVPGALLRVVMFQPFGLVDWGFMFMQLPGPCLWTIFNSPCRLVRDGGENQVTVIPIDPITLSTGRIIVGDPLVGIYYDKPLDHEVLPGRYSVRLATASGIDGVIASFVRLGSGMPSDGSRPIVTIGVRRLPAVGSTTAFREVQKSVGRTNASEPGTQGPQAAKVMKPSASRSVPSSSPARLPPRRR